MIKSPVELERAITPEIIEAGKTVFEAMAYTQTIKPIVRGYQQKILDRHQFKLSDKMSDRHGGEIVKKESETYMMRDSYFKIYLAELEKAHKKHGFNVKPGYCPLLIAEDVERKAVRALLEMMEPITGINPDDVYSLKLYNQYKEITLRMLATKIKESQHA